VREWRGGASLAGCSAGAMAMTAWVPLCVTPRKEEPPASALTSSSRDSSFRHVYQTDARRRGTFSPPFDDTATVLGIDEDTAVVVDPKSGRCRSPIGVAPSPQLARRIARGYYIRHQGINDYETFCHIQRGRSGIRPHPLGLGVSEPSAQAASSLISLYNCTSVRCGRPTSCSRVPIRIGTSRHHVEFVDFKHRKGDRHVVLERLLSRVL